ncbi:MAG: 2OG-Fe(II) oxygenase family protein [Reyranellaceae bacterium]
MAEEKAQKKPTLSLAAGQAVETDQGITLAFATPVLRMSLPGAEFLNKGLRRQILELEQQPPGRTVSNAGGFQSDGNLFALRTPELNILSQAIELAYRALCRSLVPDQPRREQDRLDVNGWANVNRDGHYNRAHSHGGVHWSGVYYVAAGQPDQAVANNGVLELIDPRGLGGVVAAPGFPAGHSLVVVPEPGLLVLFPGWLQHWVTPYRGTGERISIAFNIVAHHPQD